MQPSSNPYYAARLQAPSALPTPHPGPERQPVYARLPQAPVTASPVPHSVNDTATVVSAMP